MFGKSDCYLRALEIDPTCAPAWLGLGLCLPVNGTVTFDKKTYNAKQCCLQAVGNNPCCPISWVSLANSMPINDTVYVHNRTYTVAQCNEEALRCTNNTT
eukprot:GFYU01010545.1.p1 GENE.GFYU01010545.1~~GFYU01010545.1.p1  ORF type:complete len:117 (+),score=3.40 GFYU01010545.1:54-353(+)